MIRIYLLLLACLTAPSLLGQTQEDVNVSSGGYGMVKTNINLQCDHAWGAVRDGFGARVSYECLKRKSFTLTANAKYNSVKVDFEPGALSGGYDPDDIGLNDIHVIWQLGATATARTRLFGKPLMGIAMINSEFGIGGYERISAIAMGLLMLRHSRDTQFGIGPLVMINSTSKIPAFLVFMYRHRFNERWTINLYGGMFGVEYIPGKNTLLCAGADIDVKSFYFRPGHEDLPKTCRFTSTSFRPMLKYRHRLGDNLYVEAMGGVSLKMSCRVNGKTGTTEYFDCSRKAAPFLQASVAYSM